MIGVIGLKNNVSIAIREKFSISLKKHEETLIKLSSLFNEVLLLSTCNRTEIYFSTDKIMEKAREAVFEQLGWDRQYFKYTFVAEEQEAIYHLMKVSCGFDSKILGEDQILGQIKDAYEIADKTSTIKTELQKLFQYSITCGKEFRTECKLYRIPVSAASIAVKDSIEKKAKTYMVLGYGEIGKLAVMYALDSKQTEKVYVVARDREKVKRDDLIKDNPKVEVIGFKERKDYNQRVDSIISCTSASHVIVKKEEFQHRDHKKPLTIYDLAVPRDVDEDIKDIFSVELYDIDNLNCIDEVNRNKRERIMFENYHIVERYIKSFNDWKSIREITPHIENIKKHSNMVFEERYKVFKNKQNSKNPEELAKVLIKSASEVFANRAIEVLKEEKLKGREKECLQLIERIFSV